MEVAGWCRPGWQQGFKAQDSSSQWAPSLAPLPAAQLHPTISQPRKENQRCFRLWLFASTYLKLTQQISNYNIKSQTNKANLKIKQKISNWNSSSQNNLNSILSFFNFIKFKMSQTIVNTSTVISIHDWITILNFDNGLPQGTGQQIMTKNLSNNATNYSIDWSSVVFYPHSTCLKTVLAI